jgi:hypothetical protein
MAQPAGQVQRNDPKFGVLLLQYLPAVAMAWDESVSRMIEVTVCAGEHAFFFGGR